MDLVGSRRAKRPGTARPAGERALDSVTTVFRKCHHWPILGLRFRGTPAKSDGSRWRSVLLSALRRRLLAPVDGASVACFRVAFGALLVWSLGECLVRGSVHTLYIDPVFHVTYPGFDWLRPWPAAGMVAHFAALLALAACVLLGFRTCLAAGLLGVGFAYVLLLDAVNYQNHYYLICLLCLVFMVVPTGRVLPAWGLWLLRIQIGIPYFFGGVAKINADWLRGEPIRTWLSGSGDTPLVGAFLVSEAAVWLFSYGGLLFDLLIVPALLWRRTRVLAVVATVFFHLTSSQLFEIGVFPWLMLAATTLYLPADWPRRVVRRWRRRVARECDSNATRGAAATVSGSCGWRERLLWGGLGCYLLLQALLPFRHFLIEGNVAWTEEGHRFAWQMKLNARQTFIQIIATDPARGHTWEIDRRTYLSEVQRSRLHSHPDLVRQLCRHVAGDLAQRGLPGVEVRARVYVSLNGRRFQRLIDPRVDLAREPRHAGHAPWIEPLTVPFHERLGPGTPAYHWRRACELGAAGREAEAHAELEKTVALGPWFSSAHRLLADAAAERGDSTRAIALYRGALRVEPHDGRTAAALDRELQLHGEPAPAAVNAGHSP